MTTEHSMQLGMVGLGRMGANMVRRLMRDGHRCVVYDVNAAAVADLVAEGAVGADSLDDFVAKLEQPRAAWLMLPAAIVERTLNHLTGLLDPGDIVIDGGPSGGVWGLDRGYCLMIGGEPEVVQRLDPIFRTIAPGRGTVEQTPGLDPSAGTAQEGYLDRKSVV